MEPQPMNGQQLKIFVEELVKTGEFRTLMGSLLPELLNIWAGPSALKKILTAPVKQSIRKNFLKQQLPAAEFLSVAGFEKPERLQAFTDQFIVLVNDLIAMAAQIGGTIEQLAPEEKAAFLEKILSQINYDRTGSVLTSFTRIINDVHEKEPLFFSKYLNPVLVSWVEKFDFGTFRDFLSKSRADILALTKTLQQTLWKTPAKVLDLVGWIPELLNIAAAVLNEMAARFNQQSPEWNTETIMTQLQKIDGEVAGQLANEVLLYFRNLQEGNELLRAAEEPTLWEALEHKAEEIAAQIDMGILMKTRLNAEKWKEALLGWLNAAAKS